MLNVKNPLSFFSPSLTPSLFLFVFIYPPLLFFCFNSISLTSDTQAGKQSEINIIQNQHEMLRAALFNMVATKHMWVFIFKFKIVKVK